VPLVAYAIAHSPLVKTAFFASDPNLGRILAAVGYAGIDDLDQGLIDLHLDDVHVARDGGRHPAYREEDGQRVMKQARSRCGWPATAARRQATVWTCDLSHDYVSINADYRDPRPAPAPTRSLNCRGPRPCSAAALMHAPATFRPPSLGSTVEPRCSIADRATLWLAPTDLLRDAVYRRCGRRS
jgi:hypothetical protein